MKEQFTKIVLEEMKRKVITVRKLSQATGLSVPYLYALFSKSDKKRWNEASIDAVSQYLKIAIIFKAAV